MNCMWLRAGKTLGLLAIATLAAWTQVGPSVGGEVLGGACTAWCRGTDPDPTPCGGFNFNCQQFFYDTCLPGTSGTCVTVHPDVDGCPNSIGCYILVGFECYCFNGSMP